tara:strand:+ start:400 stop:588 length:189 start_codon:yes stop_codon:yes gene_type:complete
MHLLSLEVILDVIGWTLCGVLERIVALPAHTMTKAFAQFHLVEIHSNRRRLWLTPLHAGEYD